MSVNSAIGILLNLDDDCRFGYMMRGSICGFMMCWQDHGCCAPVPSCQLLGPHQTPGVWVFRVTEGVMLLMMFPCPELQGLGICLQGGPCPGQPAT